MKRTNSDRGVSGAQQSEEQEQVVLRNLMESDLDAIVQIDASAMGRQRYEYYRDRINATLRDSRLRVSLVAEHEGRVVGFLMATMHYGEFGRPEPTAVIDSLGVHVEHRGKEIGKALMRQFLMHARALRVERVRTEVAWSDFELLRFLHGFGYAPSNRLVLELAL